MRGLIDRILTYLSRIILDHARVDQDSIPSANVWSLGLPFYDVNDRLTGYYELIQRATTGNISNYIGVQRLVNGSNVGNAIEIGVTPTGGRFYSLTDQAAFRSAINVAQKPVGFSHTISQTNISSSTTASAYNATSVKAPSAGWMILYVYVSFSTNASGYRSVEVQKVYSSGTNTGLGIMDRRTGISGNRTACTIPVVSRFEANSYVRLYIAQNSGSTLNYSGYIIGCFIPD